VPDGVADRPRRRRGGSVPAILDLVLGINAPSITTSLCPGEVGIDPTGREVRRSTAVNATLRVVTARIREQLVLYATGFGALDRWLGDLGEVCTGFGFRVARARAWGEGVALADAQTVAEAARVTARIEVRSARAGRRLASGAFCPWLVDALRTTERRRPWWELLATGPKTVDRPARLPSAALAEAAA
jgi:hypothetical protein